MSDARRKSRVVSLYAPAKVWYDKTTATKGNEMYDEWDFDNHHPACPGGCGELADECACRRQRASRAVADDVDPSVYDAPHATPCRWRGCRDEAIAGAYCDSHLATL